MKNQVIMLLVGIVCLNACKPESQIAMEPKIDDVWIYRYIDYDGSGNVISSNDLTLNGQLYPVYGTPNNVMVPYVSLFLITHFQEVIPYGYYRMESDGLHCFNKLTVAGSDNLFLKYPGVPGDIFTLTNGQNNYTEERTIVSINDSLTIPVGFFSDLYKYEFASEGVPVSNLWFRNDVWFVKYEVLDTTGTYIDYAYELVSYTAN
jgi:hypothetical protein